jgi:hypothetical protein
MGDALIPIICFTIIGLLQHYNHQWIASQFSEHASSVDKPTTTQPHPPSTKPVSTADRNTFPSLPKQQRPQDVTYTTITV